MGYSPVFLGLGYFVLGLLIFSDWGLEHIGPWLFAALLLALLLLPCLLLLWFVLWAGGFWLAIFRGRDPFESD